MEQEKNLKSENQSLFYLIKDPTKYWKESFTTSGWCLQYMKNFSKSVRKFKAIQKKYCQQLQQTCEKVINLINNQKI